MRRLGAGCCNPHPRNRRCYLAITSLICVWFLFLAYERRHVFRENVHIDPQANKRESQPGDNGGREIINNGRVPKQVLVDTVISLSSTVVSSASTPTTTPTPATATSSIKSSQTLSVSNNQGTKPVKEVADLPTLEELGSMENLQKFMLSHNSAPVIHNQDAFPPLGPDGIVLLVQVHKRDKYLRLLLESLKAASGIEKVLLVVSHDVYSDEMNKLIKTVDFCRVIQLFYPLSMQVVPNVFPGSSKNDCPRDANKQRALSMNCTNALHPDTYGHYREAIVTAIKHHWWWKVNTVFDNLSVTKNFSGYVLFLEEDHYVAPDFLAVARQLVELKQAKCPDCDFINLGMYTAVRSLSNHVSRGVWNAGKNNMGFGMNRATWNTIRNCSKYFCKYDDYNWDWSLNQLGKACPIINRDLNVLAIRTARIFHIGTCGTHHHKSCNEQRDADIAKEKIRRHAAGLFPQSLILDGGVFPPISRRKLNPYGGWGDVRDHELCLKMASGSHPP